MRRQVAVEAMPLRSIESEQTEFNTAKLQCQMKSALLISPYFLPSNLACVHRVRLMCGGLEARGWRPIIITVDPSRYEEASDPALLFLIPSGVEIEQVSAWPSRICRPIGIGDISLRGQFALRRRVGELVKKFRPAVVFTTVLPGYTALVGSWTKRQFNVPFVLDYQDPWGTTVTEKRWNKAGLASRIARYLEPRVVKHVDAFTAVSDATLDSLRARRLVREATPTEVIPIGADRQDHLAATQYGNSLIARRANTFHIAYLGTVTSRMLPALRTFLSAVSNIRAKLSREVAVHLIGTSALSGGEDQHDISALINKLQLTESVHLHPARVSYLDALRTMQDADLLLLLGSTDSHYTASKFFPYWLSEKPILGLFHAKSTIVTLSQELGGARLVLYDRENPPETKIHETSALLEGMLTGITRVPQRNETAFASYSAEGIAERFARLFDQVAKKCA